MDNLSEQTNNPTLSDDLFNSGSQVFDNVQKNQQEVFHDFQQISEENFSDESDDDLSFDIFQNMGKLKIDMLGTSFTIQANEDNQYLEKLLGYYKRITDDVKNIDSIKSSLQVAILSGIMICDELYKEKQNKIALENGVFVSQNPEDSKNSDEIQRITLEMIQKIDKVL